METRHKLFSACRRRSSNRGHMECTGAYIQTVQIGTRQKGKPEPGMVEVRWQCSCPHHRMSNASVQADFFKVDSPDVPRWEERTPEQGKLF